MYSYQLTEPIYSVLIRTPVRRESEMNVSALTRSQAVQRPALTPRRGKIHRHAALACAFLTFAATATGCANSQEAAPTQASSSSTFTPTSQNTPTTPTTVGPKVKEGGTPRIGQPCPNLAGEVRVSANGQDLECAKVGETEMWTVIQETSSNTESDEVWISIAPTTSVPETQELEATDQTEAPSESETSESETTSSTTEETETESTTTTEPSESDEPSNEESMEESQVDESDLLNFNR